MEETHIIHLCFRGELYYADLGRGIGSDQEGCRPVVILQNDVGNTYSPTTIIAPISRRSHTKANLPTHYPVEPTAGLAFFHEIQRKYGSVTLFVENELGIGSHERQCLYTRFLQDS